MRSQDAEALATFADERKKMKEDVEEKPHGLISMMKQKNMDKSLGKALPSVQERLKGLKGKITVKGAKVAQPEAAGAVSALAGYGSDSE